MNPTLTLPKVIAIKIHEKKMLMRKSKGAEIINILNKYNYNVKLNNVQTLCYN